MSRISLEINVFKERNVYVALCPELNVSSFGDMTLRVQRSR